MTRRGRVACNGTIRPDEALPPKTFDFRGSTGIRGRGHRKAPERLPRAAGTSWEWWISSRPTGPRVGETPCGARSTRPGSTRRCERSARGDGAGCGPRHGSELMSSGEGPRRSWNHGHGTRVRTFDGSRGPGARRLAREGSTPAQRVPRCRCSGGDAPHRSRSKGRPESKPHERQRTLHVRKAGEGANRRGSEKLRGRSVAGEANPRDTDPSDPGR